MLQVARLSPRQLGEARDLVHQFLLDQRHPDGGFRDRAGQNDLYYTVFGLEALIALQADLPVDETAAYLDTFGDGGTLDFVHAACLARAWAALARPPGAARRDAIAARIESFRSPDGGYHPASDAETGSVYGAFLALGAYQDLQIPLPRPDRVLASLAPLRADDGGYANFPESDVGLTATTAAVVTIHRQLRQPLDGAYGEWLLARHHAQGGFTAAPTVPIPDLLSTATALHALATLQMPIASIQESCLDFLDTLWTNRGGFHGMWTDDEVDCEYTFYGLLALGHLSL